MKFPCKLRRLRLERNRLFSRRRRVIEFLCKCCYAIYRAIYLFLSSRATLDNVNLSNDLRFIWNFGTWDTSTRNTLASFLRVSVQPVSMSNAIDRFVTRNGRKNEKLNITRNYSFDRSKDRSNLWLWFLRWFHDRLLSFHRIRSTLAVIIGHVRFQRSHRIRSRRFVGCGATRIPSIE